eukprot:IDg2904t1
MTNPTPRECVETLMVLIREEVRAVKSKDSQIEKMHRVYQCPRGLHCDTKEIVCQNSRRFTNPFRHPSRCYKSISDLYAAFRERQNAMCASTGETVISNYFPSTDTVNKREQAKYAYLQLVVLRNEPLSIVEDRIYRDFSMYEDQRISRKTPREVMFSLFEIVENRISAEMRVTKGAILHDGWTDSGVHYIGLFAVYVRKIRFGSNNCQCTDDATRFDAETHATHIREVFNIFRVDFDSWTVCQVADNCVVNERISDLLNIPHVGCASHLLNLEVEAMVKADLALKHCLESVHATMSDCRSGLRNRAMLRNLTALAPVVDCKTRWSSKYVMLERFSRICDSLRKVAEEENSTVAMNVTYEFKATVHRFENQLHQISQVTKYLQTVHLSLSDSRLALDTLTEFVTGSKQFMSGVVKLQRGLSEQMTQ